MRTRLKDIAHDLNISTGLVSGVLNGRSNVWASDETRRRIFDAAKRLNYVPTGTVRTRPATAAGSIELAFCRNHKEFESDFLGLVAALSEISEQQNMTCILSGFSTVAQALDYLASQSATRTDPIVLWGTSSELLAMGTALDSVGCPFIVAGRVQGIGSSWAQISVNHEEMISGAVDHIRVQGHRRIAYIGSESRSDHHEAMRATFLRWTQSCFGKEVHDEFVIASPPGVTAFQRAIAPLLAMPSNERPTGFVIGAGNDAWTALELCLADRGEKLGFSRGMPSAAGLHDRNLHMLFGDALGYDVITPVELIAASLRPLLSKGDGVPEPRVRRFIPRLSRINSLNLNLPGDPTEAGKAIS